VPSEDETHDATHRRLLEEIWQLRGNEEHLNAEVAELRETLAALEETYSHSVDTYDLVPIACLTLDRHGTIQNGNRRACGLLRFSKQQLLGVPLLTLLTLAHRRRFLEHVLACRKSPDPTAFEVMVKPNEREPVAVRLSLRWTEEKGGSYAVFLIDLSERDAALADYQRLAQAELEARHANALKDRLIAALTRGARAPLSAGRKSRPEVRAKISTPPPARNRRRHRALR
ncbi:MAG TPA: PAS domain-containing protein, partial [Polyangiaceae bacterium]|jgi:PAS domain-containing protein|nr:PAS domain-containing protein [Polyangiaceae bacterium]